MRLAELEVENYRALKSCRAKLGPLACVVGENNTGKSSLLLATRLFFSGTTITANDFFDPSQVVRLSASFTGITEADLARISDEEHRSRAASLVRAGSLRLVRQYGLDGKSTLLCDTLAPIDPRFSESEITKAVQGKRGKQLVEAFQSLFQEHAARFDAVTSQAAGKEVIEAIAAGLGPDQMKPVERPLPSGIPASIRALLPEPILIPAVKDVRDELKTGEAATFGKLVSILLGLIQEAEELKSISEALQELHGLLNVVKQPDGSLSDKRLEQVRAIEAILRENLRESFPSIGLELLVPQPELRQIFATAQILVDDGVKGEVDTKGDGLKRSVIFALLRTYVALTRDPQASGAAGSAMSAAHAPYLILFEEPELYLHPSAQRVLFDALRRLSGRHQVILSTHSPVFLGPLMTKTFIKLRKRGVGIGLEEKLYGEAIAIDLESELGLRDAFQLLCYENSAAGFFADKVVLVEGDSDAIFLRHAGSILCPHWDYDSRAVEFIRLNGKGNLKRFRHFFDRFDVQTHAILDLDFLIEGLELLELAEPIRGLRNALLSELDERAAADANEHKISGAAIRQLIRRRKWVDRYARFKELARAIAEGCSPTPDQLLEIELLFEDEAIEPRRQVLMTQRTTLSTLPPLLEALRAHRLFVLSGGTVEGYYPSTVVGPDKPTRALDACAKLRTRADFAACCPWRGSGPRGLLELEHHLQSILGHL